MKLCTKCSTERPIEYFSWRNKEKGWRQTFCKPCLNEAGRENYQDNKERYKSSSKDRHAHMRQKLNEIKSAPCLDCGRSYEPQAMDFDHSRGVKEANISYMFRRRYNWERIMQEIAKCDLVCATCHRIRTLRRQQGNF